MNHPSSPSRLRLRSLKKGARSAMKKLRHALFSWQMLIAFVTLVVVMALFAITITPVRYNISIGMVPTHTITANRDVVDEVTTESLRAAAADAVQATYITVEGVLEEVMSNFTHIYNQLDAAVQYSETLEDYGPTRRYTAEELEYARGIVTTLSLRDYQLRTLLNSTRADLSTLYSILYDAIQNTMSSYVIEGSEYSAISNIMQIVGYRIDTNLLQNIVQPLLETIIEPNIIVDQEATEAARELAREAVEPVIYKQGQNIVVKGEGRVERFQYEMLSSLGLLSGASINISIYLGAFLFVATVYCSAMILLYVVCKSIVQDAKRFLLLSIILILTLGLCILSRMASSYLAPVVMGALLISAMLGLNAAIICNVMMALLFSAITAGGSTSYTAEMVLLLTCALCSGTICAMLVWQRSNRLRVITAGIVAGLINFSMTFALGLMTSSTMDAVLHNALWGAASGAISGILAIAVQPLLELFFNLPTPTKLMELSNPNHPLLRRLLMEAPGTYHHSIVVASLAEAAAEAIGANPLLARVGGYYHDVGKLRRPQYFKENQLGGENKLIETDPYTAAQIVISHARDGVTLARNYHLPREVLRIILEHHGNTPVMYFYAQALKESNGQPVDPGYFRYDSNPPSTKEGAIVLLCDTIEAAVRSMQSPTPEAIEDFIIKLIRGKLQDGQLSNSPLTLKDIDDICHACATVLNGVFHERIEYPDPPAQIHNGAQDKQEAAPPEAPVSREELTKPWDGVVQEDTPPVEREDPLPPADCESILNPPPQIMVDLSEYEPEKPLPTVEVPQPEAIPSVEQLMEEMEKEQACPAGTLPNEKKKEELP